MTRQVHTMKTRAWTRLCLSRSLISTSALGAKQCFTSKRFFASMPRCTRRRQSPWANRIFPSNSPDFFLRKIRSSPGKFRSLGPYDITIGRGTRFMDVSVTDANLKNAAVQFGCKPATHCGVFVQWSLAKQHLSNQDVGSQHSVTEGKLREKGKGWRPARPAR